MRFSLCDVKVVVFVAPERDLSFEGQV